MTNWAANAADMAAAKCKRMMALIQNQRRSFAAPPQDFTFIRNAGAVGGSAKTCSTPARIN